MEECVIQARLNSMCGYLFYERDLVSSNGVSLLHTRSNVTNVISACVSRKEDQALG